MGVSQTATMYTMVHCDGDVTVSRQDALNATIACLSTLRYEYEYSYRPNRGYDATQTKTSRAKTNYGTVWCPYETLPNVIIAVILHARRASVAWRRTAGSNNDIEECKERYY
jgi:hypothetical protein